MEVDFSKMCLSLALVLFNNRDEVLRSTGVQRDHRFVERCREINANLPERKKYFGVMNQLA